ncbi:hypothetical protein EPO15_09380 [bacterium]|nr:MAG: hypothetical protein EPO15_09380 [bacterium]
MTRALPAALFLFAAYVCASPLVDPDLWWHLAAGRGILASGALPHAEAWSWTLAGTPWVDFEWLAQLALELARRASGFSGLVALKAAACALAALLVYDAARREEASPAAAFLGALLALSALRLRAHARPELATLVFLPLFLLAARERCRRPFPLWPLAALTALWANLHGGWPLGPGVLALAAAGRAWQVWTFDPTARALALAAVACGAASFLNPYGWGAHAVVLAHLRHPPAAAGLEEWMSEGLRHFPAFWLLLAAAAGRLALDVRQNRREALFWVAVLAPLALLGLGGARFAPLFCLAAPAYVLSRSAGLPPAPALRLGMPLAAAALALALVGPTRHRRWSEPVRWDLTPRESLEFVEREGISGNLFNDYGFGGFIAWASQGRRPVYYDGRYLFQDLLGREDLSQANYAVVRHRPVLDRREWALVWFDDAAGVYLRRVPENAAAVARLEFKLADPAEPEKMLTLPKDSVLAELERRPCALSKALADYVRKG